MDLLRYVDCIGYVYVQSPLPVNPLMILGMWKNKLDFWNDYTTFQLENWIEAPLLWHDVVPLIVLFW